MPITTTAFTLAQKLRTGELKITQALDACYAAIEAGGQANFAALCREQAYARAAEIQARLDAGDVRSPLAGVPVAVDDLICTKGIATCAGSKALEGFVPPYDAAVIEKINAADMILIGKTRVSEFGMTNAVDGAAAAIAAGEAPIALGSDTGGALRRSAARHGLFALRPTYGAVSRFGLVAYVSSMDQIGPIARSAADCAALFAIIKGKDERDSMSADAPKAPLACEGGQRQRFAEALTQGGVLAQGRVLPMPNLDYALPAFEVLAAAEASSNLARFDGIKYGHASEKAKNLRESYVLSRSEGFGPEAKRSVLLGNLVLSAGQYEQYYVQAMRARRLVRQALLEALATCDALSACAEDPSSLVTPSLAGLPALALPDGTQRIGRAFGEAALLAAGDYKM
ncbi:MAG: amidase family protein [Oscillospiraceae bacterium]|nr:amidase family protein [Oscillospiraceae bacterium]